MDLTPQDVRDVQFREKMRGYHPDDVDQFLVQVTSTLERLQLRLQEADSRAADGESRSEELATTEESLKRTLVLAQRTADLAMKEAREEADRLLADARAEHSRLQTESAEMKQQLIDESQEDIRAQLAALEARRDALMGDVAALDSFVTSERQRLSLTLRETLDRLDEGAFALGERPELQTETGEPAPQPRGAVEASADTTPTDVQAAEPNDDDGGPPTEAMAATAAANGTGPHHDDPSAVDLREGVAPAAADTASQHDHDDDPFLAELRLAVTDDEPLGPRPEDASPEAHHGDEEEIDFYERDREVSGRVGSRLRRRR